MPLECMHPVRVVGREVIFLKSWASLWESISASLSLQLDRRWRATVFVSIFSRSLSSRNLRISLSLSLSEIKTTRLLLGFLAKWGRLLNNLPSLEWRPRHRQSVHLSPQLVLRLKPVHTIVQFLPLTMQVHLPLIRTDLHHLLVWKWLDPQSNNPALFQLPLLNLPKELLTPNQARLRWLILKANLQVTCNQQIAIKLHHHSILLVNLSAYSKKNTHSTRSTIWSTNIYSRTTLWRHLTPFKTSSPNLSPSTINHEDTNTSSWK